MLAYQGGTTVGRGTYWNLGNGMREFVEREGTLPGNKAVRYLKASPITMVLMGPIIGFFYVLVLPFIGIGMVLTLIASKVGELLFAALGTTAAFGWRPVEAYLMSRRKKKERRDEHAGKDDSQTVR